MFNLQNMQNHFYKSFIELFVFCLHHSLYGHAGNNLYSECDSCYDDEDYHHDNDHLYALTCPGRGASAAHDPNTIPFVLAHTG